MRPGPAPALFVLSVALVLLLPAGCKKKATTAPRIAPIANFEATPTTGNMPVDVTFTNESTSGSSPITTVLWDFGDGSTSNAMNPTHLYGSAGTYTVSLMVASADGSDTRVRDSYIVVGNGPGTTPPNADFTAVPTAGNAPLTVNFTDSSSPGSAPITAWSWTFGDGGVSSAQSPSHQYTSNGSYTVSLSVTTTVGTDTETRPGYVVVSPAPVGPTADFSGTPTDGTAPLTVNFTDQSVAGSQPITARAWTFGDGGTSTATNPSHVYTLPGTYTVSLMVTTTVGSNTKTQAGYITAHTAPVGPTAQFSGTPRTGAAPLPVQFTDLSIPGTSPITDWAWTFGDGGTSTEPSPAHTYAAAGNYTVALKVTTADGQNTSTKAGYITPCSVPAADFTGSPTTGLAPLTVAFHDSSTGAPTTYTWKFGDGATATTKDANHQYTTPGTYTVTHTAANACGVDTVTKASFVTVGDPCPNPIYTVASASWSNITNGQPGYRTRARLTWNTLVSTGCTRSVFARIYYRQTGTTDAWTLFGASACYTVSGNKSTPFSMFIQGLSKNCYDFRVALFECGQSTEVAALEPSGDPDLTNQCFEATASGSISAH